MAIFGHFGHPLAQTLHKSGVKLAHFLVIFGIFGKMGQNLPLFKQDFEPSGQNGPGGHPEGVRFGPSDESLPP